MAQYTVTTAPNDVIRKRVLKRKTLIKNTACSCAKTKTKTKAKAFVLSGMI